METSRIMRRSTEGLRYDLILWAWLGQRETYPFSRYGIKALVKGGDTNFYHSDPDGSSEEQISCAVLTSGGSSTLNQLAVQEIVMTYLDEIGRIEREEEENVSWEADVEREKTRTGGICGNRGICGNDGTCRYRGAFRMSRRQ